MSDARALSLTVITLLQLCRAEIQNTLPESWYSANIINDGTEYSPKPISEIFSTQGPSLSTNPIIVLSSPRPEEISSWPQTTWQSSSFSPPATWQSSSLSPPTTWQSSSLSPPTTLQSSSMPPPNTMLTSTMPPPSTWLSSTLPPPTTWQSSSIPPSSPDIIVTTYSTTPSPAEMKQFSLQKSFPPLESLSQIQPFPINMQQPQNQSANFFYIYQQAPQNIQNNPGGTSQPPQTQTVPPSTVRITSPSTAKPRPTPKVTVTSRGTTALASYNATTPIPKGLPYIRIRMISPKGTITKLNINPSTTTKRPTTTKTRRRRKNNYDDCLNGCKARKEPICAGPLSAGTIDPQSLKGFPSVCHMACHNSFKKNPYEKIVDGRCGKLRTRIKTVDSKDKLKRDELQKAQYTVIHNGPGQIVEFTPLSR